MHLSCEITQKNKEHYQKCEVKITVLTEPLNFFHLANKQIFYHPPKIMHTPGGKIYKLHTNVISTIT